MTDARPAVIQGCYADFKIVKTRSTFQMVIEGPIERAAEAIAMFGVPQPGQEIHVAVARLQASPGPAPAVDSGPSTAPSFPKDAGVPARDTVKGERGRERYAMADAGEKAVTRAGMHPHDSNFRRWLGVDKPVDAIRAIHQRCGIKSRSELASSDRALNAFLDMEYQFRGYAEIRS